MRTLGVAYSDGRRSAELPLGAGENARRSGIMSVVGGRESARLSGRRWAVVLVVVGITVVLGVGQGAATTTTVTGSITGTAPYGPTATCPYARVRYIGTVIGPSSRTHMVVDVCVHDNDGSFPAYGGFSMSSESRRLAGRANGMICNCASNAVRFHFTLRVQKSAAGLPPPGSVLHFRGTQAVDAEHSTSTFKGAVTK